MSCGNCFGVPLSLCMAQLGEGEEKVECIVRTLLQKAELSLYQQSLDVIMQL